MRTITVSEGQSLLDIAVEHCGDVEKAYDIAEMNSIELTEELQPGTSLKVPNVEVDRKATTEMFTAKGLKPATKDNGGLIELPPLDEEGIDFWAIEDDFEVQ